MAAYRFYNPAPVFFDLLGLDPATGGTLTFYDLGTTNLRDTWSDDGLTILNSNPVVLDGSARSSTNIFLDGDYTVLLKDGDNNQVWTRDVIPGGDAGQTIPALVNGQFLSNDGVNLIWQAVLQVPDPTGSTDQYLVTDGAQYVLANVPSPATPPDPEIVVTANSFRAGVSTDETKWLEQTGSGSATAGGGKTATDSVVFGTAYSATPTHISITPTTASSTGAANLIPGWAITAKSTTGFTVTFSTVTGGTSADNQSPSNIISPVTFDWKATGTIEVPAP